MTPWYRGFTGTIVPADAKGTSFTTFGTVGKLDATTVHISELPIRKWTQDYKDGVLEPMLSGVATARRTDDKVKKAAEPIVEDVREHHTDTTVSFSVKRIAVGGHRCSSDLEGKGAPAQDSSSSRRRSRRPT